MEGALGVHLKVLRFKENLKIFQKARDYNLLTPVIGKTVSDQSFSK